MKNNLVICRYKEDVEWLSRVNKDIWNVFIYNKGPFLKKSIKLENIGRESQVYLNHMIKEKNSKKWTMFLQANPFIHTPSILKYLDDPNLISSESNLKKNGYYGLGKVQKFEIPNSSVPWEKTPWKNNIEKGKLVKDSIIEIYKKLNINMPISWNYVWGNQFAIKKRYFNLKVIEDLMEIYHKNKYTCFAMEKVMPDIISKITFQALF